MQRRTKIVATVSSLNCGTSFIRDIYNAGVNVVRLNTAHMEHEDALKVIKNIRKVSNKIGILLDTKGPEIRTCKAYFDIPHSQENKITSYLSKAAVKTAARLNTQAIVADSMSGDTILYLAAYRGDNPIFAQV